jgi:molecular chaperone IbpA
MTYNLSPLYHSFVGLDRLANRLGRVPEKPSGYPPYNILQVDDYHYQVEIAVAGFSKEEVSVETKDNTLMVSGEKSADSKDYLYQGIATRNFKREWQLSEDAQVVDASMVNGMLVVDIEILIPEHKKPKKIEIKDSVPVLTHS